MRAAPRVVPDSPCSISSPSSVPAEFTAAHRLLRKDGFDHVISAENIANNQFKIFFVRNGEKNARLGIVVAKKNVHSAAARNRTKRIIRDVFRQHQVKLRKVDLVVMVRRAFPELSDSAISSLNLLFSRVENRCADL